MADDALIKRIDEYKWFDRARTPQQYDIFKFLGESCNPETLKQLATNWDSKWPAIKINLNSERDKKLGQASGTDKEKSKYKANINKEYNQKLQIVVILATFGKIFVDPCPKKQTLSLAQGYVADTSIKISENDLSTFNFPNRNKPTKVEVNNMDTFNAAAKYKGRGKIAVLNMASAINPGGGYAWGTTAQEEELFRRSTLPWSIDKRLNTDAIGETTYDRSKGGLQKFFDSEKEVLYADKITVVRGDLSTGYKFFDDTEKFEVAVLSIAADKKVQEEGKPDPKTVELSTEEKGTLKNRIVLGLKKCVEQGVNVLILGALGCGAYNNHAPSVVKVFNDVLTDYKGYFDHIEFAVLSNASDDPHLFNIFSGEGGIDTTPYVPANSSNNTNASQDNDDKSVSFSNNSGDTNTVITETGESVPVSEEVSVETENPMPKIPQKIPGTQTAGPAAPVNPAASEKEADEAHEEAVELSQELGTSTENIHGRLANLEKEITDLKSEISRKKEELAELEKQRIKKGGLRRGRSRSRSRGSQRGGNAELEKKIAALKSDIEGLEKKLVNLETEYNELKKKAPGQQTPAPATTETTVVEAAPAPQTPAPIDDAELPQPTVLPCEKDSIGLRRRVNADVRAKMSANATGPKPVNSYLHQALNIFGDIYYLGPDVPVEDIRASPKNLTRFLSEFGINPEHGADIATIIKAFFVIFPNRTGAGLPRDDYPEAEEAIMTGLDFKGKFCGTQKKPITIPAGPYDISKEPAFHYICGYLNHRIFTLKAEMTLYNRNDLRRAELKRQADAINALLKKGKCHEIPEGAAKQQFLGVMGAASAPDTSAAPDMNPKLDFIIKLLKGVIGTLVDCNDVARIKGILDGLKDSTSLDVSEMIGMLDATRSMKKADAAPQTSDGNFAKVLDLLNGTPIDEDAVKKLAAQIGGAGEKIILSLLEFKKGNKSADDVKEDVDGEVEKLKATIEGIKAAIKNNGFTIDETQPLAEQLQNILKQLIDEKAALEKQLGELDSLKKQLDANKQTISELERQLGDSGIISDEHDSQIEERDAKIKSLEDTIRQLRENLGASDKLIGELRARIEELEETPGTEGQIAELREQLAAAEKRMLALQEQLAQLEQQKADADASATELQSKLAAKEAEIAIKESIISELQSNLEQKKRELAAARQNPAAQNQVAALQRQIEELTTQLQDAQTAKSEAEARVRQLAIEKAQLEGELQGAQAAKGVAEDQKAAAERQLSELEGRLRTLQQQLDDANAAKARADAALRAAVDDPRAREALAKAQAEHDAKQAEVARLTGELSTAQAEASALREAIVRIQSGAQQQAATDAAKIRSLQQQLDAQSGTIRGLQERLTAQASPDPQLQRELAAAQAENQRLSKDLDEIQAQLAARQNQVQQKEAEIGRLQQQLAAQAQTISELQAENAGLLELTNKMPGLKGTIRQLNALVESLQAKLASKDLEITKLRQALTRSAQSPKLLCDFIRGKINDYYSVAPNFINKFRTTINDLGNIETFINDIVELINILNNTVKGQYRVGISPQNHEQSTYKLEHRNGPHLIDTLTFIRNTLCEITYQPGSYPENKFIALAQEQQLRNYYEFNKLEKILLAVNQYTVPRFLLAIPPFPPISGQAKSEEQRAKTQKNIYSRFFFGISSERADITAKPPSEAQYNEVVNSTLFYYVPKYEKAMTNANTEEQESPWTSKPMSGDTSFATAYNIKSMDPLRPVPIASTPNVNRTLLEIVLHLAIDKYLTATRACEGGASSSSSASGRR